MSRGACTFRQRDLVAALKAAKVAGVEITVEIERGKMRIIPGKAKNEVSASNSDQEPESEWPALPGASR